MIIPKEELTVENLKELRKKFDIIQEDLSEKTEIGRSRYENGDKISK